MEMESIKEILMRRDDMTSEEADEIIAEAKNKLEEYLETGDISAAENICQEYFGLEPDYLDELIF